jgi:biopolymer transport protein ExbD
MLKFGNGGAIHMPRGRRRGGVFSLRLTSMLDMFTILLVFLLSNYSSEGQIITTPKDLELPKSTAQKAPKAAPVIMITKDVIMLDEKILQPITEIDKSPELLIKPLYQALQQNRSVAEKIGQLDAKLGFRGNVTIQADRELPFVLMKKVMFTCGQIGYNDMYFAVIREK